VRGFTRLVAPRFSFGLLAAVSIDRIGRPTLLVWNETSTPLAPTAASCLDRFSAVSSATSLSTMRANANALSLVAAVPARLALWGIESRDLQAHRETFPVSPSEVLEWRTSVRLSSIPALGSASV
jgi:hypothetical protein